MLMFIAITVNESQQVNSHQEIQLIGLVAK